MFLRRRAGNEIACAGFIGVSDSATEMSGCAIGILEDDTSGVIPAGCLGWIVQSRAVGHEWKLVPRACWTVGKVQGTFGGCRVVFVLLGLAEIHCSRLDRCSTRGNWGACSRVHECSTDHI